MWVEQIEHLEKGKRRLHLSNGEIWILYSGEMRRFGIGEQMEISEELYESVRGEILRKRVIRRAMHLLERMDRTEQGLRRKLEEQQYPQDLIEDAIAYVRHYHYIDDRRYARTYIGCRGAVKSRGKLRMELMQKGVERSLVDEVLDEELEDRDETELIDALLTRKHYDAEHASIQEKRRMYGYLIRRGFCGQDVCKALNCQ